MRYYIYISADKIEMLLPQISETDKEKISFEFGFDLKILKSSIKSETEIEDNKYKRLSAVELYLRNNNYIGDIDSNKPWIEATSISSKICSTFENGKMTLFISNYSDNNIIALGGSTKNRIGNVVNENVMVSYSFTDRILNTLESTILLDNNNFEETNDSLKSFMTGSVEDSQRSGKNYYKLIDRINTLLKSPEQKVSFIAKRLISGDFANKKYTIATPLFVSLVD